MFADILDGFTAGVIVVDATARIVHTNAAGRGILQDGDVLSTAGGRLVASDTQVNQTLREAFGGKAAGLGAMSIAVPLMARNGDRKVAHVLPLSPGTRRRAGVELAAAAAVFVRNAVWALCRVRPSTERPAVLLIVSGSSRLCPSHP